MNTKAIKAVSIIADKKDFRQPLQVVNFTGQKAIATDGFMIAITDCNIPPQKRYCESYQKIRKNDIVQEDGNIINIDKTEIINPKVVECDYPDYEKVIPEDSVNNHYSIGLSVSVMEKLLKSLKASGTQVFEMKFSSDNLKPIITYSSDKKVKYVVMPAKVKDI